MKTCTGCREAKPTTEFYRRKDASGGLVSRCKPCARKYNNKWARDAQNHLVRRYGITQADYLAMLAEQDGVCAICRHACKSGYRLAVDHDHDSGKVRGLLCMNCNRAIGHLQDDPLLAVAAADYLRDFTNRHYA